MSVFEGSRCRSSLGRQRFAIVSPLEVVLKLLKQQYPQKDGW